MVVCVQEYEFDGWVEHPEQHLWEEKTLRLSSKAMHSRKRLEHFIKQLATAPCMQTLTLFLQEYTGGVPPSLKLAQDALSKVSQSCASQSVFYLTGLLTESSGKNFTFWKMGLTVKIRLEF